MANSHPVDLWVFIEQLLSKKHWGREEWDEEEITDSIPIVSDNFKWRNKTDMCEVSKNNNNNPHPLWVDLCSLERYFQCLTPSICDCGLI